MNSFDLNLVLWAGLAVVAVVGKVLYERSASSKELRMKRQKAAVKEFLEISTVKGGPPGLSSDKYGHGYDYAVGIHLSGGIYVASSMDIELASQGKSIPEALRNFAEAWELFHEKDEGV